LDASREAVKLFGAPGVGRQKDDKVLPVVVGSRQLGVVEIEPPGFGVVESLVRGLEPADRVGFP
jgi:hypothetical protein